VGAGYVPNSAILTRSNLRELLSDGAVPKPIALHTGIF